MNRRQFLWSTTALVASSLVSKLVGAQTADPKSTTPLTAPVKIEGNIGYNAGWVIPLEDQKALLELEAQKKKAAEAKEASTKPAAPAAPVAPAITEANGKPAKKTWGEKAQGWLDSVKAWF